MSFQFFGILIFLLIQIILWFFWKSNTKINIFVNASKNIESFITSGIDINRSNLKNRLIFFGLIFLTIAAAGPQIGIRVQPVERKGLDLLIALDTSTSMDAEDVTPSRLSKAKFELSQLIKNLKGDRVAIIVFAGSSHLYLPLTTDYDAALLFLNEIDTGMIPTQGTVLSSAINTALELFSNKKDKFKVMVLVSDGEDHDDHAVQLAEKSASLGLMINTVGVGSKNGSLIPIKNKKNNEIEYKRDRKGKLITSILNDKILQDVAIAGNGNYFLFANSADSYLDIIESIQNMEKKTISTHEFSEYEDRYQPVALLSLALFVMGFIIPTIPKKK